MTPTLDTLELVITRIFDAPPDMVFGEWLDAEALKDWFTPESFVGISADIDARAGGAWQVTYKSTAGELIVESGVFQEIVPARRLVMTLGQSIEGGVSATTIVVLFERTESGGTLMRFRQSGFRRAAQRDAIGEGWAGCLDKLARRLGTAELRRLFEDWFTASQRKDLDASMVPIAPDVVSYEHSMPLRVHGVDALREECRQGLERTGPDFR